MWKDRNDDGIVCVLPSVLVCSSVVCQLRSSGMLLESLQVRRAVCSLFLNNLFLDSKFNKLTSVSHASVLLLIINFVITLSK